MNISEINQIGDQELQTASGDYADVAMGKSISDLNSMFRKAEDCDREIFADMRSNILLVAGEHYSKKNNRFWNRLRDSRLLNVNKKLRLTKNHIQKITKTYCNNMLKFCPGVKITPQIDTEIQDVKSAELHQSVWEHIKKEARYKKQIGTYVKSFIDIGEVAVKAFYDPSGGELIGYGPKVDEETGEQVLVNQQMDMMTGMPIPGTGEPVPDKSQPVFSGAIVHEHIYAFNILRDPDAKTIDESPWLCVRKMMGYHELRAKITDPDKRDGLEKNQDETFLVFDGANGKYEQSKNQVLVREFYFRPSPEFPKGYYYISTKTEILFEDELPGGIFPIVWEGFDEIATTPRKKSIIKQLRPYQVEINRAASQAATHQITLGDDKLVVNNSAKVEHGGILPGVRVIKTNSVGVNGGIHVLPGRAGEQFVNYIESQIAEMYNVSGVFEDTQKKADGAVDIWGTLYGSMKYKKEFSVYSGNFENFLVDLCDVSLRLARFHYPDSQIIQMIGKKEQVNIEEFKRADQLCFQIKIEPASDTAEDLMGRQMMINHTLQYVGNQLEREDIGKMLREAPMGNLNKAFDEFTVNYDNGQNDILQLERGKMPNLSQYEDTKYKIQALTHRMKQSDFEFLDPGVQDLFAQYLQQCEQLESQKVAKIQRAQSGFIPDGGGLITLNGVKDSEGNTLRVPYSSLEWLVTKLADQGVMMQGMQAMNQGAASDMSQMINSGSGTIPNL